MLNGIVERVDLDKVWVVIYAGDDEFRMKITDFLKEFEREKIQWLLEEIEREASGDLPNPSFQTKLEKATYWLSRYLKKRSDHFKPLFIRHAGKIDTSYLDSFQPVLPKEELEMVLPSEQSGLILVEITPDLTANEQAELISSIQHAIEFADVPPSTTITLTGEAAFNSDIGAQMGRSTGELLVLAALLMVVVLSLVFRYVRWYLLPLLIVLIGVVCTFGAMGITGVMIHPRKAAAGARLEDGGERCTRRRGIPRRSGARWTRGRFSRTAAAPPRFECFWKKR